MDKIELGTVIAERVLRSSKLTHDVVVRIGAPQPWGDNAFHAILSFFQ